MIIKVCYAIINKKTTIQKWIVVFVLVFLDALEKIMIRFNMTNRSKEDIFHIKNSINSEKIVSKDENLYSRKTDYKLKNQI